MTDKGMRGEHSEGTVEEISDSRASDEALMVHGARILPLNPKTEEDFEIGDPNPRPPPKVPGNRLVKLESKNRKQLFMLLLEWWWTEASPGNPAVWRGVKAAADGARVELWGQPSISRREAEKARPWKNAEIGRL
jgi:hypothetical protein